MTRFLAKFLAAAALVLPAMAGANVIQFNATLSPANEVNPPAPIVSSASGIATLSFDTNANTFSVVVGAFNLSSAVVGAHIHGPATVLQNANPPILHILQSSNPLFLSSNSGGSFSTIGSGIPPPTAGFLADLQAGLMYINIHTSTYGAGEIRGQLIQVTAIPEAESYAMMLAGLGLIGFVMHRRRRS